jgi:hypothetical protein
MAFEKSNSTLIDILPNSVGESVEVHQNPMNYITNSIGVILCVIIISLSISHMAYLGSVCWFLVITSTFLLEYNVETLYLRIFLSPQHMIIRGSTLTVYMYFKKQYILSVFEVDRMKCDSLLNFAIPSSGWLISTQNNLKFVIAKPFYQSFDLFVATIQKINTKCNIDGGLLDWELPHFNPGTGS